MKPETLKRANELVKSINEKKQFTESMKDQKPFLRLGSSHCIGKNRSEDPIGISLKIHEWISEETEFMKERLIGKIEKEIANETKEFENLKD